jgi:ubiquinone biosynthesis protein UbiJ
LILTSRLALFAAIETAVNKALAYDPATRQQLALIDDQIIAVRITQPSQQLWVRFSGDQVRLLSHWEDSVDASISGRLKDFIALAKETDKNQVLMSSRMEISGNTQLLTRLQSIAAQLDIDWEAGIADVIGDVPGHWVASALKFGNLFAKDVAQSVDRSWRNYWQFESDSLINSQQYQQTSADIAKARFEADRLEAKVQRLQKRMAATS